MASRGCPDSAATKLEHTKVEANRRGSEVCCTNDLSIRMLPGWVASQWGCGRVHPYRIAVSQKSLVKQSHTGPRNSIRGWRFLRPARKYQ
eukprot:gene1414-biopygen10896